MMRAREIVTCGCKPGTYDDGWQEVRGPECQQAERDAFAQACDLARQMAARHNAIAGRAEQTGGAR